MSDHRAMPEQWAQIEQFVADCGYDACLLELRDRLAAAEQQLAALAPAESLNTSASAGSLVEVVGNAIPLLPDGRVDDKHARAAILAVADWLGEEVTADWLREEVERHD